MSTRGTVAFIDNWFKHGELVRVYQHSDSYPTGLGVELAEFLQGITVIDGIQDERKLFKTANGVGCLAAQFIAKSKTEVGQIYITPIGHEEDYNYKVCIGEDGVITLELPEEDFCGSPKEFLDIYK